MKVIAIILCAASLSLSAFQSAPQSKSQIQGTVYPANAVTKVYAIYGRDSVSANTISGTFSITAHAGNWKLFVKAKPPYKNAVFDNVIVRREQTTDIGVIKLTSN